MDILTTDHSITALETRFEAHYLTGNDFFSALIAETEIPWLLIIPKQTLNNPDFIAGYYQQIHHLIQHLQDQGFGPHYNLAKIGNKNPYLHYHLIFRDEKDAVWPDAIWCHEPLTPSETRWKKVKQALENFE
ncbi:MULTISPECIES: hypothetical protein [Thiomicrorhabdus]|uniref:HIT family protein n=1 Tax=Thiomicrorhabdus heinhorstiae TaxID=2748010 RepID=A0ABS0C058_9GAMM|nr:MULTISPECIES: hypothetical protein [Thiomicrorhabdus]MBF6058634.1 hypothetical protein [Thiomicrorhabdus heinhorstiae]